MLHSTAPFSSNMFPFGPHHPGQHPQHHPAHHGTDMFGAHHTPPHHHHPSHTQTSGNTQIQEQPNPKPRFLFKMPRVVPNQKEKYDSDEFLKRHSREAEVRYTGYRDRPIHERQNKFLNAARDGNTEIAFVATGFNLIMNFDTSTNFNPALRQCDFERESGKIHLKAPMILNGVCVRWRGWLDLERLDGVGCLEFDEDQSAIEDAKLREQVESYNRRLREFDEQSKARSRHLAGLVSSSGHSGQFPGHHLQSDLLLEARKKHLELAASQQSIWSRPCPAQLSSAQGTLRLSDKTWLSHKWTPAPTHQTRDLAEKKAMKKRGIFASNFGDFAANRLARKTNKHLELFGERALWDRHKHPCLWSVKLGKILVKYSCKPGNLPLSTLSLPLVWKCCNILAEFYVTCMFLAWGNFIQSDNFDI